MKKTPQFWDKGIQLVDGCTKVSPGCKNCWSEAMTARFNRVPEVLIDGRFNGHVKVNMHLNENEHLAYYEMDSIKVRECGEEESLSSHMKGA